VAGAAIGLGVGAASAHGGFGRAVLGPASVIERGGWQIERGVKFPTNDPPSTPTEPTTTTTAPAPTTTTTAPPPPPPTTPPSGDLLRYRPPALSSPTTVQVSSSNRTLNLDPSRDYIIQMPSTPVVGAYGVKITGGHNVVLIGGEIHHPQRWSSDASANRGLYLQGQTGTIHIEGLAITGQLTEGIQLDQRNGAVVQLQNIWVDTVYGSQATNHADVLQTWAGPRKLLVDGLSGSSTYQGLFLVPDDLWAGPAPERFELYDIDIAGTNESRYLFWISGSFPLSTGNLWADPADSREGSRDQFLWPQGSSLWNSVQIGTPSQGDLVRGAGIGYRSPGYR
jgi:hypothetical protein